MKQIKQLITPLTLAMLLAGCVNLAPKYERPAAPVAGSFPTVAGTNASGNPVAAQTPVNIAWRQFFVDARLQRLVELSLVNNRDLRIAAANIELARANYTVQRASLFPGLSASFNGSRTSTNVGGNDTVVGNYQAGLGVAAFELDLWGRVRNLTQAAQAQFFASEENRRAVQISLVASVANAYLQALADDEQLALTRQTLKTREESLRLTRLRFENGVTSRIDLDSAQSLVDNARFVLQQQLRQRAQDDNLITLLIGQPIPADLPGGSTLAATSLPDLPPGAPSDLLTERPDIRAAEQQLIGANANIGAARANYFPRIALTATGGSASTELSNLFSGGHWGWQVAQNVTMPIFDFGRTRGGVEAARAQRDAAVAQYERSIQTAFREVSDALAGQATFAEQLRAAQSAAASEQNRFSLVEQRYRTGTASYLDLLDAQRSLFTAQLTAVQANAARLQNQVTLYRVLGGGWSEPGPATAAR
jgi:NodT family efflux transporter outer membrane factor (OMF) lipoprotein